MQQIAAFTKEDRFVKSKTSERGELLRFFQEHLKNQAGKPFPYSYLGMRLSHLSVNDLYFLQKVCSEASCFGKAFWGNLKTK